jgi:hypothetical protein
LDGGRLIDVVLTCRAVLIGIFAVSLASKVRGRSAYAKFRESVVRWRVLSRGWSRAAAAGVVVGEAAVVVLLALPWAGVPGFALAGALLAAFTVGISLAMRRGRAAACRCFGAGARLRLAHVVRNLVLLGVCVVGAAGATVSSGAPRRLPESAVALSVAAVGVLFVTRFDDLVALMVPTVSAAATGDKRPENGDQG